MSLIICMVSELKKKKKDKILIKIMVYRLFCQHTLSFLCHWPQCQLGRPCMMMVMMMMIGYGHDLLWIVMWSKWHGKQEAISSLDFFPPKADKTQKAKQSIENDMPSTPKQNSGVGRPTDSPAKARRTCLFPRVDTGPHQAHCHHHP